MALGRKFLKALGLEDAVVDTIIEAHSESIEALKKQRDDAFTQAGRADELAQQLKDANEKLEKAGDAARVQADFDAYKQQVEGEKTAESRKSVMASVLKDKVGIERESARNLILSAMKMDQYEWDDNGQLKNEAAVVDALRQQHAEWIASTQTTGVPPVTPPPGGGGRMTRDEIMKIEDTSKRQQAIAENLDLFQSQE